jgi:hypothetical protein
LRQRWPDARIELAGNATAAELARSRGVIDAAHSQHEARWSALFGTAPLPADFAAWLARFDLVVNYWPDPDGELQRRFPARDGQVFLPAPAMPTIAPAAAHYAAALKPLGLETRDFFCLIEPGARPMRRLRFIRAAARRGRIGRSNVGRRSWRGCGMNSPRTSSLSPAKPRIVARSWASMWPANECTHWP